MLDRTILHVKTKVCVFSKINDGKIINIPYTVNVPGPLITSIRPILSKKVKFRVSFEENRNGRSKKDFSFVDEIRLKESGYRIF